MVLAVEARNLWIGYLGDYGENTWIIKDASFSVVEGEVYCIVGESGCGKSTLGRAVAGILPPHAETRGLLRIMGRDVIVDDRHYYQVIRGRIVSWIPQNPGQALHPYMRIRDQFRYVLKSRYGGISDKDIREHSYRMLRITGLNPDQVYDRYPHELSGGMQQRIVIALALSTGARILVADEPTSSLDAHLRLQILKLISDLRDKLKLTIILITHDLLQARRICDRIMVLYAGYIVEEADTKKIFEKPLHPYTRLLMETIPILGVRRELKAIPGEPVNPGDKILGCPFYSRCPLRMDKCRTIRPGLIEVEHGHRVACHLIKEGV